MSLPPSRGLQGTPGFCLTQILGAPNSDYMAGRPYGLSHLLGQIITNLNTAAMFLLHVVDIGRSSYEEGERPELFT